MKELIEPPKKKMKEFLAAGTLQQNWGKIIKGRPKEYAAFYEIISNWRGGLDVDRLDYFMRDCAFTGKTFPHNVDKHISDIALVQYDTNRVTAEGDDANGTLSVNPLWTIGLPRKTQREHNYEIFDFRLQMYAAVYRHEAAVKIEQHLVKAIDKLDKGQIDKLYEDIRMDPEKDFSWRRYTTVDDCRMMAMINEGLLSRAYFEHTVSQRQMMDLISKFELEEEQMNKERDDVKMWKWLVEKMTDEKAVNKDALAMLKGKEGSITAVQKMFEEAIIVALENYHRGNKFEDPTKYLLFFDSKQTEPPQMGSSVGKPPKGQNQSRECRVFLDPPLDYNKKDEEMQKRYSTEQWDAVREALHQVVEQYHREHLSVSRNNSPTLLPKRTRLQGSNLLQQTPQPTGILQSTPTKLGGTTQSPTPMKGYRESQF